MATFLKFYFDREGGKFRGLDNAIMHQLDNIQCYLDLTEKDLSEYQRYIESKDENSFLAIQQRIEILESKFREFANDFRTTAEEILEFSKI